MSNYISTHWGTYKFFQDKNKKIKLNGWKLDDSPTEFGLELAEAAKDDLRIKQPHVRKGCLEKKFKQRKV